MLALREHLQNQTTYSPLDVHLADYMTTLAAKLGHTAEPSPLWLASLAVSQQTSTSNACALLPLLAGTPILPEQSDWCFPDWPAWQDTLSRTGIVGTPGTYHPLILDPQGRLYLYRYWLYEHNLAQCLLAMLATPPTVKHATLRDGLSRLFPPSQENPDWQRMAAAVAILKRFSIISGGPGTGKTTTVLRILALLLEQGVTRLALAAPTGKAAARLKETIRQRKPDIPVAAAIREQIPEEALTLHRLLGYQPERTTFRHHREHPLPYDVVVVDEASMIDLAMMAKLVDAVAPNARLILLGDRDQLASVEAGSVLGDLCQQVAADPRVHLDSSFAATSQGGLTQAVVVLQHSHRFSANSGIGQLARAIQQGDSSTAVQVLQTDQYADVTLQPLPAADELAATLTAVLTAGLATYFKATEPGTALQALEQLRILCSLRRGPWGVEHLNQQIENLLAQQHLLDLGSRWYHLRPVMITSNDYSLQLFNGDIGVLWQDHNGTKAWFRQADQSLRAIHPQRLPAHETAWAMTVHKSQGSEFEHVVLMLGAEANPLLTRELVYTAVTRARQSVQIWGSAELLRAAVQQVVTRHSGLQDYFA